MILKLVTAPTIEPVTLLEAKAHLRVDSTSVADNTATSQSIVPGSHAVAAAYSLEGTGVDVLGKNTLVNLNSGANGSSATVDAKIQESDDDSTYTDWSGGAFTQVTEANDNAIQEKAYTGTKQYIRVVCTVATAACSFSVDVITEEPTSDEDDLINSLIVAARQRAEGNTGRRFITSTWDYYFNEWPDGNALVIPYAPLYSTDGITGVPASR